MTEVLGLAQVTIESHRAKITAALGDYRSLRELRDAFHDLTATTLIQDGPYADATARDYAALAREANEAIITLTMSPDAWKTFAAQPDRWVTT